MRRADWKRLLDAAPPSTADDDDFIAADIITTICASYGVSRAYLVGPRRHRYVVQARHLAMTLIRLRTTLPLKAIGVLFNRDHSSVVHATTRGLALLRVPGVLGVTPSAELLRRERDPALVSNERDPRNELGGKQW